MQTVGRKYLVTWFPPCVPLLSGALMVKHRNNWPLAEENSYYGDNYFWKKGLAAEVYWIVSTGWMVILWKATRIAGWPNRFDLVTLLPRFTLCNELFGESWLAGYKESDVRYHGGLCAYACQLCTRFHWTPATDADKQFRVGNLRFRRHSFHMQDIRRSFQSMIWMISRNQLWGIGFCFWIFSWVCWARFGSAQQQRRSKLPCTSVSVK